MSNVIHDYVLISKNIDDLELSGKRITGGRFKFDDGLWLRARFKRGKWVGYIVEVMNATTRDGQVHGRGRAVIVDSLRYAKRWLTKCATTQGCGRGGWCNYRIIRYESTSQCGTATRAEVQRGKLFFYNA